VQQTLDVEPSASSWNTGRGDVGVWAEILRGFTTGKDAFIFHLHDPSPFLTYFVNSQFQTEDEILAAVDAYTAGENSWPFPSAVTRLHFGIRKPLTIL